MHLNLGALLTLILSLFYVVLEPFAGFTWSLVVGIPLLLSANAFSEVTRPSCRPQSNGSALP